MIFFFLIFHFNWTPFVILFSLFTATGNSVTQSTQGLCLSYQFNVIPILFLMQITTYNLHFCKRKLKVNNKGHHVCYINIFDLIFNLKLKSVQRKSSYIDDSNFLLDMNYRFTQPISEKIKNSLSVLAFLYILSFFLIWRITNYFGFWYFIQMSFVFFLFKVCLKLLNRLWTIFNENIHTHERNTIEIDEMEIISRYLHWQIITRKKSQDRKNTVSSSISFTIYTIAEH